jgi:hypothetical protein
MHCVNCGKQIAQNSNFCEFCGIETKIIEEQIDKTKEHTDSMPAQSSGLQIAALVMGIIGLFMPICALLAIIFGGTTLKERPNKMAKWGLGLGIFVLSLWIIGIMAAMVLAALSSARQKAIDASKVNYIQQVINKG